MCVHSSVCVYVYDSMGGTELRGACRYPHCSERGLQQPGKVSLLAGVSRCPSQTTHSTPGAEDTFAKAHQGPTLALRRRAPGSCGVCCAGPWLSPPLGGSPWVPQLLELLVTALSLPFAPGSGSSSCLTRCSTPCTASLSMLARTTTACRSTLPPPSTPTTSPTSASSAASSPW